MSSTRYVLAQLPRWGISNLSPLGGGANGEVYHGQVGENAVTVKVYKNAYSMTTEARVLSTLSPARVHDTFFVNHIGVLVMEHVHGVPLSTFSTRPVTLDFVENVLIDILDAIIDLDRRGVVHRDIKPDNIIVSPEGKSHLIDFGSGVLKTDLVTTTDQVLGSPAYTLPQLVLGTIPRPYTYAVWQQCELYSLAVSIYELTNQNLPYYEYPRVRNTPTGKQYFDYLRPRAITWNPPGQTSRGHNASHINTLIVRMMTDFTLTAAAVRQALEPDSKTPRLVAGGRRAFVRCPALVRV